MMSVAMNEATMRPVPHPNHFDQKRIERALKSRKRYRYVSPNVMTVAGGYRIESPCCSRNVDPEGGIVDVALLLYDDIHSEWQLFRKNHTKHVWELDSTYNRLVELLEELNADPERKFWQ